MAGVEGTKGQALEDEVRGCSGSWTCMKTGAFTLRQTPGLQPRNDLVHGVFQQVTLAAWRTDPGQVRAEEETDRKDSQVTVQAQDDGDPNRQQRSSPVLAFQGSDDRTRGADTVKRSAGTKPHTPNVVSPWQKREAILRFLSQGI